jgi:hypothetical protein
MDSDWGSPLSTLIATEQTVEQDEVQTVDWDDAPDRLRVSRPSRSTRLECRWVRDEASGDRLISVWYESPR